MRGWHSTLILLALLLLASGCKTTRSDVEQQQLQRRLGGKIPLWVELECTQRGKPRFGAYSVLKMPDEKVGWALARLDENCRVYGTLIPATQAEADLCDIRFRSRDPVVVDGRCRCVPGRYVLEEGYPTSKRCCEKYPDKVYCRKHSPPTDAPPEGPSDTPDSAPQENPIP